MYPKSRFLGVEHEVIVEEEPPFFLGDELHARVKVRNLKPKPVKRRFYYILRYPGGMAPRPMEFVLGPNEEKVHPLYDNKPPYYLGFMGNFQIILLKGEQGRRFNEEGKLEIHSPYSYDTLFAGNVRDRDGYELQARTTKAVEMMSENIDAIRESNKQIRKATHIITTTGNRTLYLGKRTLYLTIAIGALAATEFITLVIR